MSRNGTQNAQKDALKRERIDERNNQWN